MLIKFGIAIERPWVLDERIIHVSGAHDNGFSCPSGHATSSVAVYGGLAKYYKKTVFKVLAVVLIIGTGLSRVALGVHYPTDVLVGWALGAVVMILVSVMYKHLEEKWIMIIIFATAIPGLFYCKTSDYFTSFGMLVGIFAGFFFEDRFVKFKNTKNVIRCIVRLLCGMVIFFALTQVTKLPFDKDFLDSGNAASNIVRIARYAVSTFLVMSIYPMLFKVGDKIFERKVKNG